ncbi:MAG: 1-phosphofructokinase [Romboutsia sp.]
MITVITFNPSIDRLYKLDTFEVGKVQRAGFVNPTAGGKGLNVSKVIKKLGETPTCLGFLGGYNGEYIKNQIEKIGVNNEFINIDGETRICLNIIDSNGVSTEILEKGPIVSQKYIKYFEDRLDEILRKTEVLVASGSLAQGLPIDYYKTIGDKCRENGVKYILDTSGLALEHAINTDIYLIKPNTDELGSITNRKIDTLDDVVEAGKVLLGKNIENICVSMGKDGMVLLSKDSIYEVQIPEIDVLNPVGSGDSSVAGFAYGLSKKYDLIECLRLANACGISNALHNETGDIELSDIYKFTTQIKIKQYSLQTYITMNKKTNNKDKMINTY